MCYSTTRSERPKIADKDIIVWKVLKSKTKKGYPPRFEYGSKFYYQKGILTPRIRIRKVLSGNYQGSIIKGYHFCWSKEMVISRYIRCSFKCTIHKFIIPKGTRYFSNVYEGVAEQLILIK